MTGEERYLAIGRSLENAVESQLFGKPCFKVNGKPFVSFFENTMVFKLSGDAHREAMSFDGSRLFDPSRKGRPMKEWVQLTEHYAAHWEGFAKAALEYVTQLSS